MKGLSTGIKSTMKSKWLIFILILLLGAAIRFYALGDSSFWIDEAISATAADQILHQGIPVFASGELYSRSLVFHYLMAGALFFSHTEFAARSISVIFGLATSVLIFYCGRIFGKETAWISFILFTFLEITIVYSREARMYQATMFLFFLTLYLMYEKKLTLACISFLFAFDTHPVAALLAPILLYELWKGKANKLLFGVIGFITAYGMIGFLFSLKNIWVMHLLAYLWHIKYYFPFAAVSVIGMIMSWRHRFSSMLFLSIFLVLLAGFLNSLFAYRYIYLIFFPIIIFASIALSKVRGKYVILGVYMVITSNLILPFSYTFVLIPAKISHYDPTAPYADFRSAYAHLPNLPFVATFTPAAAFYSRNPDYWLNFSFSGRNDSWLIKNGKEIYTGATVAYGIDDLPDSFVAVIDRWGFGKLDPSVQTFINNCVPLYEAENIGVVQCSQ